MKLQPGLDRTRARAWVYHPTDPEQDKQVYTEEAQKYYDDGWLDTPAKRGQVDEPVVEEKTEEVKDQAIEKKPVKKAGRPPRIRK